jgi:hypothetical protein
MLLSRKKIIIILGIIATLLLLASRGTFSWLKALDKKTNDFKTGQYGFSVNLKDVFQTPASPMKPGDQVMKIVNVKNEGDISAIVRVMVFPVIIAADGKTPLPAKLGEEILVDINTNYWTDGGDGYYYYNKILESGKQSENLFNVVALNPTLGEKYKNATLFIDIKSEAWHNN